MWDDKVWVYSVVLSPEKKCAYILIETVHVYNATNIVIWMVKILYDLDCDPCINTLLCIIVEGSIVS